MKAATIWLDMRILPLELLAQPVKLLGAGNRVGDGVLAVDDDRCRRIGDPDRCDEVCGGLQIVSSVIGPYEIGRPRQNNICSRRSDCQLRPERKAEHRAIARAATSKSSSIESIARKDQTKRICSIGIGVRARISRECRAT